MSKEKEVEFRCPKCGITGKFPEKYRAFHAHRIRCINCGLIGKFEDFRMTEKEEKFNPSMR